MPVAGKLQMVRGVTGVHEAVVLADRVVHGQLPPRALQRIKPRGSLAGSGLAEGRVVRRANARRIPDVSLRIEHRIVSDDAAVPDTLLAPISRRLDNRIIGSGRRS